MLAAHSYLLLVYQTCGHCRIHKERVEKWEEEIRELRARDIANEQTRAVLHNAQLQLYHIRQ